MLPGAETRVEKGPVDDTPAPLTADHPFHRELAPPPPATPKETLAHDIFARSLSPDIFAWPKPPSQTPPPPLVTQPQTLGTDKGPTAEALPTLHSDTHLDTSEIQLPRRSKRLR